MRFFLIFILTLTVFLGVVSSRGTVLAQESLAYQMALLHTKALNPGNRILKNEVQPTPAMISEFQWILDTLENRCLNPEQTIADTIVKTWLALRNNRKPMPLLTVARELSRTARNTRKFGPYKVNFRMTSQYWLQQKLGSQAVFPETPATQPFQR